MISYVNKLGTVRVGGSNPVRIMGILNTSPESFYKKSVSVGKQKIVDAVYSMEEEGANFIDVGANCWHSDLLFSPSYPGDIQTGS